MNVAGVGGDGKVAVTPLGIVVTADQKPQGEQIEDVIGVSLPFIGTETGIMRSMDVAKQRQVSNLSFASLTTLRDSNE